MLRLLLLVCLLHSFSIPSLKAMDRLIVGAEQPNKYLPLIKGKRVGLLVNQTSRIGQQHLVDYLIERKVNMSIIFAPEHGFRGNHGAGESFANNRDKNTGVEIFSIYGKHKKPLPEDMKRLDALIFDVQDVGVRFYTYITNLHHLMEACAEYSVPLIVLDRPNPNGDYIDGPILDKRFSGGLGIDPLPMVHGLTVGELAMMINGEGWLSDGNKKITGQCDLTVIPVKNYTHERHYKLPIKPSPNLPNELSVKLYPSIGLFEATPISVGRGTEYPFQVLGYPDSRAGDFRFVPKKITGSWSQLNYAGQTLYGEKLSENRAKGIDLGYWFSWQKKLKSLNIDIISRPGFLDKLAGTDQLRKQIQSGKNAKEIYTSWLPGLRKFQKIRKKYLLYQDAKQVIPAR